MKRARPRGSATARSAGIRPERSRAMDDPYRDIIDLPHKQSVRRKHMPVAERAAQFAPFAALVGYDDAIRRTARKVTERLEENEQDG